MTQWPILETHMCNSVMSFGVQLRKNAEFLVLTDAED